MSDPPPDPTMADYLARAWTESVRPGRDPTLISEAAQSADASMADAAIAERIAALDLVATRDHVSRVYFAFLNAVQTYRVAPPEAPLLQAGQSQQSDMAKLPA